ncbi:hypothetical protein Gotur_005756 [Gossypium turneri]
MGSRMIINYHIPTPFAAEALACLQRVQMGLDLRFKKECMFRYINRKANETSH